MLPLKIGVITDCFRVGVEEGVRKAAAVGVEGVQVYAVAGEMAPEKMDAGRRAAFKALCAEQGVAISALCGDMGGGFHDAKSNPGKIERSKAIVDLAVDLETAVVTTHVGVVPADSADAAYQVLLDACGKLAEHAAGRGVTFAIETGPETAATLKRFVEDVGSPGLGVNLDPANLIMVLNDDPVQAVRTLGEHIVHTHAKDGVQVSPCDPMRIYHGDLPPEQWTQFFSELPLGEGGVDWDAYLAALVEVGYKGYLTIEREVGDDPAADIAAAVAFLRKRIG